MPHMRRHNPRPQRLLPLPLIIITLRQHAPRLYCLWLDANNLLHDFASLGDITVDVGLISLTKHGFNLGGEGWAVVTTCTAFSTASLAYACCSAEVVAKFIFLGLDGGVPVF